MTLSELTFENGEIRQALGAAERDALLDELHGWRTEDDSKLLVRTFTFDTFVDALAFTNKVGELAEHYNHHPEIVLEYGKATVKWWTHTANGIASNDFLLARETSALYPD